MSHVSELLDKVDTLSRTLCDADAPPLSQPEVAVAAATLSKPLFKSVVRVKQDPQIHSQEIGLFSFTPAVGVQPNKYGIYGTAKLRGNFANEDQAQTAAEHIIRTVDSANEIYHVRVGQEFPLTKEVKFVENFEAVDLSKEVSDVAEKREIEHRQKEKQEKKVIIDREKKLLQDHKKVLDGTYEEEPLETYIMLHVKRSQLTWTLKDTERRIREEITPALDKARAEIQAMNAKYPDFRDQYFRRYMEARADAGLPNDFNFDTTNQIGFMRYLMEDEEEEKKDYE